MFNRSYLEISCALFHNKEEAEEYVKTVNLSGSKFIIKEISPNEITSIGEIEANCYGDVDVDINFY